MQSTDSSVVKSTAYITIIDPIKLRVHWKIHILQLNSYANIYIQTMVNNMKKNSVSIEELMAGLLR